MDKYITEKKDIISQLKSGILNQKSVFLVDYYDTWRTFLLESINSAHNLLKGFESRRAGQTNISASLVLEVFANFMFYYVILLSVKPPQDVLEHHNSLVEYFEIVIRICDGCCKRDPNISNLIEMFPQKIRKAEEAMSELVPQIESQLKML